MPQELESGAVVQTEGAAGTGQDDAAQFVAEQEQDDTVTLADVLGDGETVADETQDDAADPTQDTEGTQDAGKPPASQKDIDRALGRRLHAGLEKGRKQWETEHAEDLRLARLARQILGEDPLQRLIEAEAKEYAQKNNTTEELALDVVRWRRGLPPATAQATQATQEQAPPAGPNRDEQGRFAPRTDPAPADAAQGRTDLLTEQAQAIQARDNVNMVEILQQDDSLRARVVAGDWDINTAYGYYLARQTDAPQRPRTPSAIRTGASQGGAHKSVRSMSTEEFQRLEQALSQGARVRLE